MVKIIPVVIATAIAGFGAGVWTQVKLAGAPVTGTAATTTSTISPFEMQLTVKPRDLPEKCLVEGSDDEGHHPRFGFSCSHRCRSGWTPPGRHLTECGYDQQQVGPFKQRNYTPPFCVLYRTAYSSQILG